MNLRNTTVAVTFVLSTLYSISDGRELNRADNNNNKNIKVTQTLQRRKRFVPTQAKTFRQYNYMDCEDGKCPLEPNAVTWPQNNIDPQVQMREKTFDQTATLARNKDVTYTKSINPIIYPPSMRQLNTVKKPSSYFNGIFFNKTSDQSMIYKTRPTNGKTGYPGMYNPSGSDSTYNSATNWGNYTKKGSINPQRFYNVNPDRNNYVQNNVPQYNNNKRPTEGSSSNYGNNYKMPTQSSSYNYGNSYNRPTQSNWPNYVNNNKKPTQSSWPNYVNNNKKPTQSSWPNYGNNYNRPNPVRPYNPAWSYYPGRRPSYYPTTTPQQVPYSTPTPTTTTSSTYVSGQPFQDTDNPQELDVLVREIKRLYGGVFRTEEQIASDMELVVEERKKAMSRRGLFPKTSANNDLDFCCPTNIWQARNRTVKNIEGETKNVVHLTQLRPAEYQYIPHGTCQFDGTGRCERTCIQESRIHYVLVSEFGSTTNYPPVSFDRVMVPAYCSCKNAGF